MPTIQSNGCPNHVGVEGTDNKPVLMLIRSRIPGASMTVIDAAHIANVEQPHDYTDAVLGFPTQK